jgi:hypothetical protein
MFTIQQSILNQNTSVIHITNQIVDLSVSLEFGPRILFFGFCGGPNHFFIRENDLRNFATSEEKFHFFGGHRLWAAPEDTVMTYIPDNKPFTWDQIETTLVLSQVLDSPLRKLAKQISIQVHPNLAKVELTHRLTNIGDQPIIIAPWAITQMAPGGIAVLPLPPRGSHIGNLLPTSSLVLWPYTDLTDPRWRFGYEYLRVQQDLTIAKPLKFGLASNIGWLAYFNHRQMFQKQIKIQENAVYPDLGTPLQIFLDGDFLELETMGPLECLQPGQTLEHQETWQLFANCPPPRNEQQLKEVLKINNL